MADNDGEPDFDIRIRGEEVEIDGWADLRWYDRYWWNTDEDLKGIPVAVASFLTTWSWLTPRKLDELRLAGLAAAFEMESRWDERLVRGWNFGQFQASIFQLSPFMLERFIDELDYCERNRINVPRLVEDLFSDDVRGIIGWVE
jgi:hypothetical protein